MRLLGNGSQPKESARSMSASMSRIPQAIKRSRRWAAKKKENAVAHWQMKTNGQKKKRSRTGKRNHSVPALGSGEEKSDTSGKKLEGSEQINSPISKGNAFWRIDTSLGLPGWM